MLPIYDLNRPVKKPHVTRILIIVNVAIFLAMLVYAFWEVEELRFLEDFYARFSMVAKDIVRGQRIYTLLTSMFLHGGLGHLCGNMLFLYVFGDNIEDALGHGKYFLFYVFCGIMAGITHILSLTSPDQFMLPVIGASGAISGILGAYFVLYPRAKILTLIFYGWIVLIPIPAILFLGIWFLMQWTFGVVELVSVQPSGIAYWAHIGGFLTGVIVALVFRRQILESQRKRRKKAVVRNY